VARSSLRKARSVALTVCSTPQCGWRAAEQGALGRWKQRVANCCGASGATCRMKRRIDASVRAASDGSVCRKCAGSVARNNLRQDGIRGDGVRKLHRNTCTHEHNNPMSKFRQSSSHKTSNHRNRNKNTEARVCLFIAIARGAMLKGQARRGLKIRESAC